MTTTMPETAIAERSISISQGYLGNLPYSIGVNACGWGQIIYDGNNAVGAIEDPNLSLQDAIVLGKVSPASLAIELKQSN